MRFDGKALHTYTTGCLEPLGRAEGPLRGEQQMSPSVSKHRAWRLYLLAIYGVTRGYLLMS